MTEQKRSFLKPPCSHSTKRNGHEMMHVVNTFPYSFLSSFDRELTKWVMCSICKQVLLHFTYANLQFQNLLKNLTKSMKATYDIGYWWKIAYWQEFIDLLSVWCIDKLIKLCGKQKKEIHLQSRKWSFPNVIFVSYLCNNLLVSILHFCFFQFCLLFKQEALIHYVREPPVELCIPLYVS